MITTLAGGVGAAKFLAGLQLVRRPSELVALVNVGDDFVLHGLRISPDLDTVTYTLAGAINPETGWGLAGETWAAMGALDRYGGESWFRLGDKDLATHLYRTQRRSEGATLSEVTAEITRAWGVGVRLVPISDDPLATVVTLLEGGDVDFQDYFVRQRHDVPVAAIRVAGADQAAPAPGALEAIAEAEVLVIAPSNPIVSIGPVLAVPGVRAAVEAARERCVAVAPIVGGVALKGPADRLLRELGHESSVVGVARIYRRLCSVLVVDEADAHLRAAVEAEGVRCLVAPTVMRSPETAAALAGIVLDAVGARPGRG
ncbi:MAG: 2-phospho-L-lactate transferase [Acidimicrobiia bacterium]|nr:2-phospho-L-lactate transferase [Acidimicrobiia bacterium]